MSLAQLSQLLPLTEEELQQVIDYALTLSKADAASHFGNLLGDSPLATDFITSFNSRRVEPVIAPPSKPEAPDAVPKARKAGKKKKPQIHEKEARKVQEYGGPSGTVYSKKDQDFDYIPQKPSAPSSSAEPSRSSTPKPASKAPPKQHASSTGFLISDHPPPKAKSQSNPVSRKSTPKPAATKISIAGGTPMTGQSSAIADLDAAIRALELTTNPTLDNTQSRRCNCLATKHPLQSAAPNCLSCGKVICAKEGLGPCTFCGTPLLSPAEVQSMMRELREERGRERMAANAEANRKPDVARTPAPFTQPRGNDNPTIAEAEAKARQHRDKLLNFQAQNAQRTTVRDEAADFDVSGAIAGTGSMWASPEERARELKRQQKLMREMEWNARPEYEKRKQVVSIDLVGGKVVRKMVDVERPASPEEDPAEPSGGALVESSGNKRSGGAFSGNPLLGSLIKPVFDAKGKGVELEGRRERKKGWRRVQDDLDDNERVILDGGAYGGRGDEPECG
ncbi:putative zinc finger motif, C2HC5-type-domain-containing protein [Stachybotrys elegans]|uniref:Zinc finger motif, C2HC5-type-domain-containing protein n=1 Tax=Stachybotrys elegans TaxID=80388 RepID=A0A8K0T2F6_9HYPO|nr:putative zinc finger motif, C2HC5-type-domain-containing protein [Stachybotrys elegans]